MDLRGVAGQIPPLGAAGGPGAGPARPPRQKGSGPAATAPCRDGLESRGLIDDAAVAGAFVRARLRQRPGGRARLTSELRAKGIERSVASATIARVFADEEVSDTALAREAAAAWLSRQGATVRDALGDRGSPDRDKARRRLVFDESVRILARRARPDDMAALAASKLDAVDLVAVHLHPFAATAARPAGAAHRRRPRVPGRRCDHAVDAARAELPRLRGRRRRTRRAGRPRGRGSRATGR